MTTTDQGGGPIKYILANPPCDGGSGLALFVPPAVMETISDAQRRQIALIQTQYAQRVATLLAAAYEEIGLVIRDGDERQ